MISACVSLKFSGPCQLSRQLDENLLRQHNLLVPSNYLVTTRPSMSGPKRKCVICVVVFWMLLVSVILLAPSLPSHRRPTITSDQHSKITHEMYIATRRAVTPKVRVCVCVCVCACVCVTAGWAASLVDTKPLGPHLTAG